MSDDSKVTTERFKPRGSWTTAEHVRYQQTGEWPLDPDYVKLRQRALENAGLEPEPAPEKAVADMSADEIAALTTEDFYNRLRKD